MNQAWLRNLAVAAGPVQHDVSNPLPTCQDSAGRELARELIVMQNARSWAAMAGIVALTATACTNDTGTTGSSGPSSTPVAATGTSGDPRTIEQPDVTGLQVAPDSKRVDLEMPSFSDPTNIDNPLFPVGREDSNLLLGKVDGERFRTEVTVLPETRFITWEGQRIETVVSQYTAYLGGRINEVALDLYAEDDSGAVWYFGEDVFNFELGVVADTEGTWFAGKDGPAAMIMPADPQVGDVYRPENIPGNVFEEVTVLATDQTVNGPQGRVAGALLVSELHMDGQLEDKTFAPGYGEFLTSGGGDTEALALSVPTDELPGSAAAPVEDLWAASNRLYDATVGGPDAGLVANAATAVRAAASDIRNGDSPPLVRAALAQELGDLKAADRAGDLPAMAQESVDIGRVALDLRLRHQPRHQIDLERLGLWTRQLVVDVMNGSSAEVAGDLACLDLVLGELRIAAVDEDASAARAAAASVRTTMDELSPISR